MKKILLLFLIIIAIEPELPAQPQVNPGMNELKEKVIGWDKMQAPLGNAPGKSLTVQGRTYTSYQIGLIDTFTNWIKKSYIPVGGLPQPQRMALPDDATRRPYVPKGTGVIMGMWVPCYDASGKKIIKAQPSSASYITILTNHINGIERAGDWYNTPSQYYFTMYYDTKGKLVNDEDAQKDAPYVNEIKSKIGNYFIYFTRTTVNVVLMPGKELPIVQATKAEVLDKAEGAVQRAYANKSMPLRTDILDNIKKIREKYKNSLQEPAFVKNTTIDMYTFYPSFDDLFEKKVNTRYMFPVYKTNPAIYDLGDKDKPQWVTISWPYATEKSSTVDWEIFKAMTTNFNFQYVYDYFFNPEKEFVLSL